MGSTLDYSIIGKDVSGATTLIKFGDQLEKVQGQLAKMKDKRVLIDVAVDDKGAITKLNAVSAAAEETNKKTEAASGGGVKKMGSALGVLAGVVAIAGGATVVAASKFDETGAKLSAMADVAKTQADKINNAFLGIGSTSTFTGAEVATAFEPIAAKVKELNGGVLDTTSSLNFMNAAMDASEATGGNLTATTAALAAVMETYGIGAGHASAASDILSNVSHVSGTSIADLANGMDKLHAKLGVLAPSLADTGALTAELAEHGITGSRGLLTVNTAMSTLLGGSKATKAEIQDLGLKVTNSKGQFVGMGSIIEQLNPKLSKMGEAQQVTAEKALFGAGSAGVLNGVIKDSADKFADLTKEVSKTGSAHEAAEKSTATFGGQMEKLKAGVTDTAISMGQKLMPYAMQLVGVLKDIFGWIQKNVQWFVPFVTVVGAIAAAIFIAVKAMAAWKAIVEVTTAVQEALNITMDENVFAIIILAIVACVAAFIYFWNTSKGFRDFWKELGAGIVAVAEIIWHNIVDDFTAIVKFFEQWGPLILTALVPFIGLPLLIFQHWGAIKGFLQDVWNDVYGFFKQWGPLILAVLVPFIGIPLLIIQHWQQIATFFTRIFNGIMSALKAWWSSQTAAWQKGWSDVTGFASRIWKDVTGFFSKLWSDVTGYVKKTWSDNVAQWTKIWNDVTGLARRIWTDVRAVFQNLVNDLHTFEVKIWNDQVQNWKNAYNDVVNLAKKIWTDVKNVFLNLVNDLHNLEVRIYNDEINGWKKIWADVTNIAKNVWHDVSGFFQNLWKDLTGFATRIRNGLVTEFTNMKNDLINIFRDIANTVFVAPINFVIGTVIDKGVGGLLHDLGKVFGQNWSINVPQIQKFATGGPVPGSGNADNQLILATPGEWVLSKSQVSSMGGLSALSRVFGNAGPTTTPGGFPGYSLGGLIGDIGSGISNVASKAVGAVSGLVRGGSADIVQGILNSTIYPLAKSVDKPGLIGGLPTDIATKVGSGLVSFIRGQDSKANASGAGGQIQFSAGAGVKQWDSLILRALTALGQSASWLQTVERRMNQESGGNPNAINRTDINAQHGDPSRGLMQTIMTTFNAYKPSGATNIYDPYSNIYAGLNYAIHRYGSLAALSRPGGYALGGIVDKPTIGLLGEAGTEMVLPLTNRARVRQLLNQAGVGQGSGTQVHRYYNLTINAQTVSTDDLEAAFRKMEQQNG